MKRATEALQAFETLFPERRKEDFQVTKRDLSDFPIWLRGAVNIYTILLGSHGTCDQVITLILPKEELAFNQLLNVYRQVSAKTGPKTLLIADHLSPRFRPLLVKFRIPFVFKNESIFAPELGLVFKGLRSFKSDYKKAGASTAINEELRPLSTKLLAAYLSGKIARQLTLRDLHHTLTNAGAKVSAAKLSLVLSDLVRFQFLVTEGAGPHKTFSFDGPQDVWQLLRSVRLAPFMRIIQGHYLPQEESDYVLAGESALAGQSDLNAPTALTIATTPAIYRHMKFKTVPQGDFTTPGVYIQVWKEDPRIFSTEHQINPIELYLSMKDHQDERVQSALGQILSRYGYTLFGE